MTVPGESWGRIGPVHRGPVVARLSRHDQVPEHGPWLAWGHGRSYGDVPCNATGTLIDTRSADRFLAFDPESGTLCCESGVLLKSIQYRFVRRGWFLPVVPGTELVTVGGAVANDVHGKNHHVAGTFGRHVARLEIVRSGGERIVCGPRERPELFRATVGGLGLTGLISWVEMRLRRVSGGGWLSSREFREPDLDTLLDRLRRCDKSHEYTAAWFDCLAPKGSTGRGIVSVADHATFPVCAEPPAERLFSIPSTPPISPVRPLTVRAFNALYYRCRSRAVRTPLRWYRSVLHPLDRLENWNRLYGHRGFLQCQIVVPEADHREVLRDVLQRIRHSRDGSLLSVLKRFGDAPSVGWLSFPRAGFTLSLDFPRRSSDTERLIRELYDLALDAGGAVYPAKDAIMTREQFNRSFPMAKEVAGWRDPAVASDFAARVGLV